MLKLWKLIKSIVNMDFIIYKEKKKIKRSPVTALRLTEQVMIWQL